MASLVSKVHRNYGIYTSSEKKIAEALLSKPDKIKYLSIQELASFCDVSTSTITRFVQKNGYKNFIDFRLAIPTDSKPISHSNTIVDTVTAYYEKNISHSVELIDLEKIKTITNDIKKKKMVYIWGLGSSGRTSSEFEQTLTRMGILVKAVTDPHMLLLTAPRVTKEDLVIIISISGRSEEILAAMSLLDSKCKVAVLTSDPNSFVAKKSDYILQISDIRINDKYFVNFQLSLIFLIDCIAESLLLDQKLRLQFDNTVELLKNHHESND